MSATSRVRIQRDERGRYTVVDEETGITVEGTSKADALETLTATLRRLDDLPERETADLPTNDGYDELSERVQARFEDRDITEEDIEDAIEWHDASNLRHQRFDFSSWIRRQARALSRSRPYR